MWAELCCMMLLAVLAYTYYNDGMIPSTEPYYHKQVETYYWATMRARTCADVVKAMDEVSSETLEYMKHHSDELEGPFPRAPLQQHVMSLQCVDGDGDAIAF